MERKQFNVRELFEKVGVWVRFVVKSIIKD